MLGFAYLTIKLCSHFMPEHSARVQFLLDTNTGHFSKHSHDNFGTKPNPGYKVNLTWLSPILTPYLPRPLHFIFSQFLLEPSNCSQILPARAWLHRLVLTLYYGTKHKLTTRSIQCLDSTYSIFVPVPRHQVWTQLDIKYVSV